MKNCSPPALPNRLKRLGLSWLSFLVSLISLGYANAARAEGEGVLDKKITLIVQQKEMRQVLNEISKLVEIKFVYSAQKIPSRKKVSVLANDQRVGDILNSLLEPLNVFYYVSGNQVVLMQKSEQEALIVKLKHLAENSKLITRDLFFKTITGKVTDEKGAPLLGVSVTVKGTTRGTTTNANGAFTIDAEVGETLEFSMVGFAPFSIKVGSDNSISITMQPDISDLGELVVIGYGTQKRTNVTGAISNVTSKTVAELPVPNVSCRPAGDQ
jgi:hypothetical protein